MLLCKLCELYQDTVDNYKENGRTDYDAGQVEGIRKAIKVLEDLEDETTIRGEMWSEVTEGFEGE